MDKLLFVPGLPVAERQFVIQNGILLMGLSQLAGLSSMGIVSYFGIYEVFQLVGVGIVVAGLVVHLVAHRYGRLSFLRAVGVGAGGSITFLAMPFVLVPLIWLPIALVGTITLFRNFSAVPFVGPGEQAGRLKGRRD